MRPPLPSILASVLAGALALAWPQVPASADGRVNVEINGLDAEMKRNVLGSLELASVARDVISSAELQRMAGRAPEQIALALQPYGFYDPVIKDTVTPSADGWTARFDIDPGRPVLLSEVNVKVEGPGAEDAACRKAVGSFPLKPGSRLEHAPYEALKVALNAAAASGGYLDGRYEQRVIEVDRRAGTARITLHYQTGPRFFFGPVRISQDVLDSAFVNSFVPFRPGEPYAADSLIALQNAFTRRPYFSRVEVEPRRDEADSVTLRVPIDVRLEHGKRVRYTLGVGYGNDTGPQTSASLEFNLLNRSGHRAELSGLLSTIRQQAGAQFHVPRALGRSQLMNYSATFGREETNSQKSFGGEIGVALSRARAGWQEAFGLHFLRESFTVGLDTGIPNLLMPDFYWSRSVADDPIMPRAARWIRLRVRATSEAALSTVSFVQLSARAKRIQGVGARDRLLMTVAGGKIFTQDFRELPPKIRYFGGGAQDVRAFRYQELGPRDATGEPTGGASGVLGQLEYERRVLADWAVCGFYDLGGIFEGRGEAVLGGGPGIGLRWISPVGMVRLDLAFPLQKADLDPPPMAVQFSIGPEL